MTTRTEIIAQIDAELDRLQRARDFLVSALAGASKLPTIASLKNATTKAPKKSRPQPVAAAVVVAAPLPQPKEEPQVHRVPPKRRMERRHVQSEKHGKSPAALSGLVPTGPVAVSADEARKVQERAVPAPPAPVVSELRSEIAGERSLGSLIQAFERRTGLSGIETP